MELHWTEHERARRSLVIPTSIVIPVRDQLDLTTSIIQQLWHQPGWDRLQIYDNGSGSLQRRYLAGVAEADPRVTIQSTPDLTIYEMWNDGFAAAREEHPGAVNVAFLNNDVLLQRRTLETLALALRSRVELLITYPDYDRKPEECDPVPLHLRTTVGTYRHGGMSGCCFMVAADRVTWAPLVDPQFTWWAGDDDLAFTVEAHGGQQARVECLGLHHDSGGTARHHEWVHDAVARDMELLATKWPGR